MQGQMGATLHTGDLPVPDILRYAREAEALGYHGFWLTEESGKEAFALLALLSQATQRITLATGIVNFYSRTPTLLAMGASTIWRLSGGRFLLGLGTGGIGFMERGHGIAIERPLARARETVAIVRGLLHERRFSYDGQWFHIRNFGLREGPIDGHLPIVLSALNPGMIRVACQVADGLMSNWPSRESIQELQATIARECGKVGRDPGAVRIYTLLMTCPDPDDPAAVAAMRRGIAFYCATPHYHHIADVTGLGDQVRRVYEVWQSGDYDAASALVTDAMCEAFTLTGSRAHCAAHLRWLLEQGVYPVIYPLFRRDRVLDDHLAAIRLAASYLQD